MKKKILFFIESLSGGGAEQVLVTMLRHFDYNKYDVTLLTVSDVGVHLNDIDYNKVHYKSVIPRHSGWLANLWYSLKYKLIYQWLPARLVAWLIIPSGFDTYIAFVEGYSTKIIGRLPARMKKIAYVHIDLQNYPWTLQQGIYRSLDEERDIYNQYDKVVCVSHSVEEVMRSHYGLDNTITIYNPIDVEFINQKAKEQVDITLSSGINFVTVGRLAPQKGYDLLIPIIARLRSEGMDVSLYILGDGGDRELLEGQILELGVQKCVHLMGYRTNPHAIVSKMDVFVCSSRAEGYSLVIAEALSIGVPVISTNCAGPNELLEDGKYGVLCEDYDQLYEALKNVILNPSTLIELRLKSKERGKFFSVCHTIKSIEKILE